MFYTFINCLGSILAVGIITIDGKRQKFVSKASLSRTEALDNLFHQIKVANIDLLRSIQTGQSRKLTVISL